MERSRTHMAHAEHSDAPTKPAHPSSLHLHLQLEHNLSRHGSPIIQQQRARSQQRQYSSSRLSSGRSSSSSSDACCNSSPPTCYRGWQGHNRGSAATVGGKPPSLWRRRLAEAGCAIAGSNNRRHRTTATAQVLASATNCGSTEQGRGDMMIGWGHKPTRLSSGLGARAA
jgi:hypothetical protein